MADRDELGRAREPLAERVVDRRRRRRHAMRPSTSARRSRTRSARLRAPRRRDRRRRRRRSRSCRPSPRRPASRGAGRVRTAAARCMMSRPTAFEPVNVTNATSGCSTSGGPISSPTPGRNASAPGGSPASSRISTRRDAMPGVCSAGLNTTVLPVTSAAVTMPGRDREREVPRRDDDADAARLVPVACFARPAVAARGAPSPSSERAPAVVLAEVDRLAHVGVGFGQRLARLEHAQRRELVAAAAHEVGGAEQHRGAVAPRRRPPRRTRPCAAAATAASTWSTRAPTRCGTR